VQNAERFAHLDCLEQQLMKHVLVIANAYFSMSCVLLTHNDFRKNKKESSYTSSA